MSERRAIDGLILKVCSGYVLRLLGTARRHCETFQNKQSTTILQLTTQVCAQVSPLPTVSDGFASEKMISSDTLYMLANSLGVLAMITVIGYHFVAVNARYLAKNGA